MFLLIYMLIFLKKVLQASKKVVSLHQQKSLPSHKNWRGSFFYVYHEQTGLHNF